MALQVWLSLNGDLNNQGLKNVTVTNGEATIDDNGKIGKCYRFGTAKSFLELPAEAMNDFTTECTVSFWLKILTRNTSWATYFQAGLGGVQWNNYVFGFLRNGSGNKCCFTVSGEAGTSSGSFVTSDMELDTWYHITLVYQTGHCLIYMNGMLYHDYPTAIVPAFNNITTITIGCANIKTSYQSNCLLNDLRIYDHALSPREVKQVSAALVLHYPLSMPGGENLAKNTSTITDPSSNGRGYRVYQLSSTIPSGTTVTISCRIDADNITLSGNKRLGLSASMSKTDGTGNYYFETWKNYSNGLSDGSSFHGYISNTKVIPGDMKSIGAYLQTVSSGTVTISKVKVEIGDKRTPWLPNPADPEYSVLGLNDGIEYDVSGYNHNGTKHGITYDSDTPRYQVCAVLDGTSYIKIDTNEWMVSGAQALTWSLWAYSDDWSTETDGGRLISCTESGGFNLEGGASGYLRVPFYVFKDSEGSSKGYVYYNSSIQLASLTPGWHLFTTTYSTEAIKTYVDGALTYSYSYTSYGIGFNKNARLFLGCEAATANPGGSYFNGKLSDFRLYYTTLSAEDVYNLYAVGASLSDTGVLFSNEVSEV